MLKKFALQVACALAFGFLASGICFGSDYGDTHPPLNSSMFSKITTPTAKTCTCVHGDKCTCEDECTCPKKTSIELNGMMATLLADSIACTKRAAARRAARQQQSEAVDTSSEMQIMEVVQPAEVVATVAAPADNKCPCCGMTMTPEQMEKMKAKTGNVQTLTTVKPHGFNGYADVGTPIYTNFQARPMLRTSPVFNAGRACSGGNCGQAGGFRIFRR